MFQLFHVVHSLMAAILVVEISVKAQDVVVYVKNGTLELQTQEWLVWENMLDFKCWRTALSSLLTLVVILFFQQDQEKLSFL